MAGSRCRCWSEEVRADRMTGVPAIVVGMHKARHAVEAEGLKCPGNLRRGYGVCIIQDRVYRMYRVP